jgi:hypothetical protein
MVTVTFISPPNPAAVPVAVPEAPPPAGAAELFVSPVDAQPANPAAKTRARIPKTSTVLYNFIQMPPKAESVSFHFTMKFIKIVK